MRCLSGTPTLDGARGVRWLRHAVLPGGAAMPGRAWHGIVRRPQGHRGQGTLAVTRETSTVMPISSQASLSVELPKRALRTFRSLLRIASLANYEVSWRRRRRSWHAGAWMVFRPVCSRRAHDMMKQGAGSIHCNCWLTKGRGARDRGAVACFMRDRRSHWSNWPDQLDGNCICRSLAPADRMLCLQPGFSRRLTDLSIQPVIPDT